MLFAHVRRYMAPEMYLVKLTGPVQPRAASPAVDVYAFGVMMWELLVDWTVASAFNSSDVINALPQYAPHVASSLSPECNLETLACIWEYPPMHHIPDECPASLQTMAQRCWSYTERERPAFVRVAEELQAEWRVSARKMLPRPPPRPFDSRGAGSHTIKVSTYGGFVTRRQAEPVSWSARLLHDHDGHAVGGGFGVGGGRGGVGVRGDNSRGSGCTGVAGAAGGAGNGPSDGGGGGDTSATPSTASQVPAVDEQAFSMAARAYELDCWRRAWHRCGLHFPSHEGERAFDDYMRSDHVYSALRWPFLGLALTYLTYLMLAQVFSANVLSDQVRVIPTLLATLQFGTAFLLTLRCCKAARSHVNVVLGTLALLYLAAFCGSSVYLITAPELQPLYHPPDTNGTGANLGIMLYTLSYGVFFLEALTIPVVLLVLSLPLRLYGPLVALPALTAFALLLGRALPFVVEFEEDHSLYGADGPVLGTFRLSCIAALLVIINVACVSSAVVDERARRALFVLHSALQSQSQALEQDAAFRRYREIMRSNREAFGGNEMVLEHNTTKRVGGTARTRRVRALTSRN
jgi:hypothetical protein